MDKKARRAALVAEMREMNEKVVAEKRSSFLCGGAKKKHRGKKNNKVL